MNIRNLVLFGLISGFAAVNAFAQRPTGTITGRVISEDGQPIPRAAVNLSGMGGSRRVMSGRMAVITDDEGNFTAEGLDPAPYRVSANAPGYVPAPNTGTTDALKSPNPGYTYVGESVTIRMVRGGVITGKVTNALGEPIVGIRVVAVLVKDEQAKPINNSGAFVGSMIRQTDDRGIYRLYGLAPGSYLVQAGGGGLYAPAGQTPFGSRVATYYPSSLRDAAVEVVVRSGEEATGVDIRYRSERGWGISGKVRGAPASAEQGGGMSTTSVTLRYASTGAVLSSAFIPPSSSQDGYAFYGIPNGEYEVIATRDGFNEDGMVSSPRRVIVNGHDVTGIDLTLTANASISGTVTVENPAADAQKCESKREFYLEETIFKARRDEPQEKSDAGFPGFTSSIGIPDAKGAFSIRNLRPGRHRIEWQLPDENWYIKSMTMTGAATSPAADPRNGIVLKSGERLTGLTINLATGAARLSGKIAAKAGAKLPSRLHVHLLPAETDAKNDLLRYAETLVENDGAFNFVNLAPGKYLIVTRTLPDIESDPKQVRFPVWDALERAKLRKEAEAVKAEVELKPCQRVSDYELKLAR